MGFDHLPQLQGLVRLAPESLSILNQPGHSLMQSAGQSLGSIVNNNGIVVAQARFLPIAGAQAASLGPLLAPAAVLLAIQMRLASIARKVDVNISLTREVLKAGHEDQWNTLNSLYETTFQALQEAEAAGTVNQHIFEPLASRKADLLNCQATFVGYVKKHLTHLDSDSKSRRNYVQQNFDQILADAHGMLMAEFAWYRFQVLRGILISQDTQGSIANERLLAHHVDTTKSEHSEAMRDISNLLADVEGQIRLLAALPAARSLPFTAKRKDIENSLAIADALASTVSELRNQLRSQRKILSPVITVFKDLMPDGLVNILTWSFPEQTRLLAIADANQERLLSNNVYLGITDSFFFVADQSDLLKEGKIEQRTPLSDIRYVRYSDRSKRGPRLEIITKDQNLVFSFDSWASEGEALDGAKRLGSILASAMNLPSEEKSSDPLITNCPVSAEPMEKLES